MNDLARSVVMKLQPERRENGAAAGATARPAPNGLARSLQAWHRRVGLTAALIVLLLAVTGLMLNHARRLHLDRIRLDAPWLLALYGRAPASPLIGAPLGGAGWAVQADGRLYLPAGEGAALDGRLVGVVATRDFWVVASGTSVLLFTPQGALVETVAGDLPLPISGLGLTPAGAVAVRTARGVWVADAALAAWTPDGDDAVRWSQPIPPPAPVAKAALARYAGAGIPLERVIADVHSGRVLGVWGAAIMDAAAILFIVLGATGTVLWWLRRTPKPPAEP